MLKIPRLFCLCTFLFLCNTTDSAASHMTGGEITWECLPNGQFVFYMEVYRECTGTTFFFNNQTISYQDGSIPMKPDSSRWLEYGGNGNISVIGLDGCQRQCDNTSNRPNSEVGATQFFPYVSDPITLNGFPPAGGWLFTWTMCCRASTVVNLANATSLSFTLRARMFYFKGKRANICYDSSPRFHELPAHLYCKGNEYFYNHNTYDKDLDSIVYSWDYPWDTPYIPAGYNPGFNYNNPLPDQSFHALNIPASLNAQTGEIHFSTFSGQTGQQYATCVRVDSYREGVLIASVYREMPFIPFDCPPNDPPFARFDNKQVKGYVDSVFAGEFVSIPIEVKDTNIDSNSNQAQMIAVSPRGQLFSLDYNDSLNCRDSTFTPCATLSPEPVFDTITGEFSLKNQGLVNAFFEWQTDCVHLGSDTGKVSNYKTYNFIFKSYDEACDVPGIIYPSITIVVERFEPKILNSGNMLSVHPADSYQWYYNGSPIPNSDTNKISMSSNGLYSVEVVKDGCPSKRVNYLLNVSLNELNIDNYIKAYPNPFKNGFVVEIGEVPSEKLELELMDVSGRVIKRLLVENKTKLEIGNDLKLEQGIYILKVSSENQSILKKMVKL